MTSFIPFSGNPLDRASNLRRDEDWLKRHLYARESRFLPFHQLNVLAREADESALHWLDHRIHDFLHEEHEPLLLGVQDGVAHFAVDVSFLTDPVATIGIAEARFTDARRLAPSLPGGDAGIVAQARSLLEWHRRHRFCGTCGSPTRVGSGGNVRVCVSCGAEHFPGPHAVVIMVVWRGDQALLGRGKGWAEPRYSALAGFIDQGETIEEAVAREVLEEAGVAVDDVRYHTSQPWPFPMSLMLGCFAHAASEEIHVDPGELADARWFSRAELRRAFLEPASVGFGIPGNIAIAHHLIKHWCEWE